MQFRIRPRFCLILMGVMLLVFGVSFAISNRDLRAGEEKLAEVYAAHAELSEQIQQLQEDLDYAQTDEYVERVARDELGLMRPGEVRYVSR